MSAHIDDLLAGFTDTQLQEAIRSNRAILQTRCMPTARKALAREILTALHAEAGKRAAQTFVQRHYH